MSPQSKREYREAVHLRYKNATRHEKTAILDEFCATCGCHRKHAIRVLKRFKRFTRPKPKRRGKPPVKRSLTKQLENLNPFLLRRTIDKKLKIIFSINNKPR